MGKKSTTYLIFELSGVKFAVTIHNALEVLRRQKMTFVPNTAYHIKGIVNFRGNILTVTDLKTKLKLSDTERSDKFVIIVFELMLNKKPLKIGGIADRVNDVVTIENKDMLPVPDFGTACNPKYLDGTFKIKSDFILVLNIEKIYNNSDKQ